MAIVSNTSVFWGFVVIFQEHHDTHQTWAKFEIISNLLAERHQGWNKIAGSRVCLQQQRCCFIATLGYPEWMGSIRLSLERTGGIAGYLDCFPKITGSYAHNVVKKGKVNWSNENKTLVSTLAISLFFSGSR